MVRICLQCGRPGFSSWVGKIPWRRASHSSILAWRIPRERGAWWAAVHGAAKTRPRLSDWAQHSTSLSLRTPDISHWAVFSLLLGPLPLVCSSSPNSWTFQSPSSYCQLWLKIPLMSMRGQSGSRISPVGCVQRLFSARSCFTWQANQGSEMNYAVCSSCGSGSHGLCLMLVRTPSKGD